MPVQKKKTAAKKAASKKAIVSKKNVRGKAAKKTTPKKVVAKKAADVKVSTKKTSAYKYVLAPGGYRLCHLVKRAPKKGKVCKVDWTMVKSIRNAYHEKYRGKLAMDINKDTFINHFGPPGANVLNPHWVAYAACMNDTGQAVKKFTCDMTVPDFPENIGKQTIFLFIGIQDESFIIQPVLQYGISRAGGGAHWSITSWFAGTQSDPVRFSREIIEVDPGTELTAVIESVQTGGKWQYNCFFEGHEGTRLEVPDENELKFLCATLESYNVLNNGDYPNTIATAFRNVSVNGTDGRILPGWQPAGKEGPNHEHSVVLTRAGNGDEIDLHYSIA